MSVKSKRIGHRRLGVMAFLLIGSGPFFNSVSSAAEPGWSPVIIATGEYRQHIESLPIEQRPYRPLHFYGNTVRRNHYRGTPIPLPRADVRTTTRGPIFRGR